jgi:SMC interacting uncharacterized protein involved in chromosome segregation
MNEQTQNRINELQGEIDRLHEHIDLLNEEIDELQTIVEKTSVSNRAIAEIQDEIIKMSDNKTWFVHKVR